MRYLIAIVILIGSVTTAFANGDYAVRDLGVLSGFTSSYAWGINSSNQVVGYCAKPGNVLHAFLWQNGTMTDLGTLSGGWSWAWAINDGGVIVGRATTTQYLHPTYWNDGAISELPTFGGREGAAYSINNEGQVVGYSVDVNGVARAVIWENGVITTLAQTNACAWSISDNGYIVGSAQSRATLWSNGTVTDLGTPEGSASFARDVNNNGQIVGYFHNPNHFTNTHAFLWQSGVSTELSSLGGSRCEALGINANAGIVGYATTGDGLGHAVLWKGGLIAALDDLGGGQGCAEDINCNGVIVGHSILADGSVHATLWEPVPEPSSVIALLTGLGGIILLRKKTASGV